MANRLSASRYLKNNVRKVCLIAVAFGLFLSMFYCIGMFLESNAALAKSVILDQYDKTQIICVNEGFTNNYSVLDEVRGKVSKSLKAEAICCDIMSFDINTVIGEFSLNTAFLMQKNDVKNFLDYNGVKIIDGAMPQNAGEMLIGKAYAKNMKTGIGEDLSIEDLSINISPKYKIVGIIDNDGQNDGDSTPCYLTVGVKLKDAFPGAVVIFANGTKLNSSGQKEGINYSDFLKNNPDTAELISGGQTESDNKIEYVVDYTTREKQYEYQRDAFTSALSTIRTVSTAATFICLIAVFNLYMKDRFSEWCLYNSIGYSSKEIYLLIVRELLMILGFAVAIGIIGYMGLYFAFSKLLFEPIGMTPVIFVGRDLLGCLSILVLFFGILQISVFCAIQRIITVDVIDDSFI